jgi:hypothetical protein
MWLAVALCVGCAGPKAGERPSNVSGRSEESDAGWVIRGTTPEKLLLSNGEFGVWITTDRGIADADAFRQFEGEVLVAIPGVTVNGEQPKPREESLEWTLNLRTGAFISKRTGGAIDFETRVVLHPTRPIVATQWTAISDEPYGRVATVECGLPLIERQRKGSTEVSVYEVRSEIRSEADELRLALTSSTPVAITGFFLNADPNYLPTTYDEVMVASKKAYDDFWKTDIEIDGPVEDQLAIRTMLYYLRRGATPKLSPFGASNSKYRGARFWDAEAWMLPVLAIVDSEMAKKATKWRIENLGEYVPWEAAVGGTDVTPKEFGNALHVAGWVAWWVNRANHLGLVTDADAKKVLDVVFPQFYKAATDSERGMEIKQVESPDEGRLRDNDLVTNLLAKRVGRLAADHGIADGEDLEWFNSIVIPKAADGLPATYDNDLLKGYQQTAALLALYPLQEYFGAGVAEKMFDRYAGLTSEVGPAMSESIHATIAARLGRRIAYTRWRKSWQTYTDDAMMFHERRNKQDAYFMTGAAGCLQTVLYGFAGMNIEKEGTASQASNSLGNGYQVAFRPHLPAEWKSLVLRNIYLGSRRATVRIDHSGVSIE